MFFCYVFCFVLLVLVVLVVVLVLPGVVLVAFKLVVAVVACHYFYY